MSQILRAGDRFSVGGGLGTHFFLFGDKVFSPGRDTCSACGYSSWALELSLSARAQNTKPLVEQTEKGVMKARALQIGVYR